MRVAPLDGEGDFLVTALSSVSSSTIATGGSNFLAGLGLAEKTVDKARTGQSRIVLVSDGGESDETPSKSDMNALL